MTLEQQDKQYVLQTYARDYTNFVKGVGATLYDENGKDYIDFAAGIAVNSVGHANPKLVAALCEQAQKIIHISNLQVIEPQAKLAQKIVELSGYDMGVFFANSGAEANEGAIKIARKYGETRFENKRYKVITLEHSFHGRTITTVKATGQASFHVPHFSPYPDGFSYEKTIADVFGAIDDETVAVLIELVQGEGGVQPFEKEEVQALAKHLKEKNILLIVDEVQTGVYRTGEFLASNLYEIEPDIITLAKGLGGGVPIGAVMTRHKEVLSAGDHGSTFGGNYLSTAAGLAVLEILQPLYESGELDEILVYFTQKLQEVAANYTHLFEKEVGLGLMRGLRAKTAEIQVAVIKNSMKEGLVVLKAGRNTIRFLPSLTISKNEIDEGFKRFENVLRTL
ncbi:MAG TPA: aspartate aminotransferase family protein [Sulfurovum sp.]|jgi:acetylornithine aminotransferase|nr:MAG: aspartate aminotransferase family protein [Sulfurovum sp. 35-42-20]OYZ24837.1 MAG: aspartate aminotransferase family protein [Sulfurovum sp. 16-42-52]OYZ50380.1 MAG: aspartate aminotransferase family protein [Sulfurovum sp. 24-42-9]OZA44749.1 MAG: aspartate aminotransferase family protein [Sulfurovum sp. 17-42-90]OZA59535.1 MAG: aspartate aminotransferase family protein [Sulfurovum sp. 39-42-12]HQR74010.1 aspartate aminotransferase family protein [Sulfurovum sp.]